MTVDQAVEGGLQLEHVSVQIQQEDAESRSTLMLSQVSRDGLELLCIWTTCLKPVQQTTGVHVFQQQAILLTR
ncbi:hypothetical protein D3C76_1728070 [compost metagenome]